MKKYILLIILFGIIVGHVSAAIIRQPITLLSPSPSSSPTITTTPTPVPEIFGIPQRLEIPKLSVNAVIGSVGKDSEGRMDIPSQVMNTAWYSLGPKPGQDGSAVIDGHVDTPQGTPAVFAQIGTLIPGDTISVMYDDGKEVSFGVANVQTYPLASMPLEEIFNTSKPGSYLNLITCTGSWNKNQQTYTHRLVVYTERLNDPQN